VTTPTVEIDEMSYEQAFKGLEEIVRALESNERTLEESLELFARGQALSKRCQVLLDQAELKVQQLIDGELVDFPLEQDLA